MIPLFSVFFQIVATQITRFLTNIGRNKNFIRNIRNSASIFAGLEQNLPVFTTYFGKHLNENSTDRAGLSNHHEIMKHYLYFKNSKH